MVGKEVGELGMRFFLVMIHRKVGVYEFYIYLVYI